MPVNRIVEFKSGPTKERSINLSSDLMCLQKAMKRSVPFWIYAYSIIKLWKKFLTMYLSSKNTSIVTKQKQFRKMVNFKVFWGGTPEGVDRFWWNQKKALRLIIIHRPAKFGRDWLFRLGVGSVCALRQTELQTKLFFLVDRLEKYIVILKAFTL